LKQLRLGLQTADYRAFDHSAPFQQRKPWREVSEVLQPHPRLDSLEWKGVRATPQLMEILDRQFPGLKERREAKERQRASLQAGDQIPADLSANEPAL
jgi:hypothetical protein